MTMTVNTDANTFTVYSAITVLTRKKAEAFLLQAISNRDYKSSLSQII
jgi:hypothetical protein